MWKSKIVSPEIADRIAADFSRGDNIKTLMARYAITRYFVRKVIDGKGLKRRVTPLKGPTIREFSLIEAAYIAGLVDGEGHIQTRQNTKGLNCWAKLCIYNTSQQLMDWLSSLGGTVLWRWPKELGRLACGEWQVYRAFDVYNVLHSIYPFLKIKYPDARSALMALSMHLGRPLPDILLREVREANYSDRSGNSDVLPTA